jgi:rod shape-determining protein MreC
MALADIRYRPGIVLGAAIALHLVAISLQVTTRTGDTIFTGVVFGGFAELQRATGWLTGGVQSIWTEYIALRQVRAENDALRSEVGALQVALQQERAAAERADAFRRLLEFKARTPLTTTGADVIGAGASPEFRTVTIDKGERDGVSPNMAVIAAAGVVGRVTRPSARASLVQLLVDANAAAGALIARSRVQGVIVGAGDEGLRMDYVPTTGDVVAGDEVVTSGIDGLYPKGLAIGVVERVERGDGLYHRITVRPAVDFSRLEDVLVVLSSTAAPPAGAAGPQP